MILGPTQSLEIKLPGAVTTNQLPWTVFFNERNDTSKVITVEDADKGTTNGATAVSMVAAPASGSHRTVRFNVRNKDTVSQIVTIQINYNGTPREFLVVTLAVGDTLNYRDICDWDVLDSAGQTKTSALFSGVLPPPNGGTGIANNTASTITISGNFASTFTVSNTTAVTFPTAGTLATLAGTETLTNKRITARTGTTASSATPTINTDNVDFYSLTAQAAAITSFTTNLSGTPTEAQRLWIAITDDGTARAITWGASFEASTVALPTTTVVSTRLDVGFVWNTVTTKWRCVAVA